MRIPLKKGIYMNKVKRDPLPDTTVELSNKPKFTGALTFTEHYQKHVVVGKKTEKWERLDENILGKKGAEIYERLIGEAAEVNAQRHKNHCHRVKYTLNVNEKHYMIAVEKIYGWDPERKIVYVLKRFLENKKDIYFISTGFREGVNLSEQQFCREMHKKATDGPFSNGEKPLADHA